MKQPKVAFIVMAKTIEEKIIDLKQRIEKGIL